MEQTPEVATPRYVLRVTDAYITESFAGWLCGRPEPETIIKRKKENLAKAIGDHVPIHVLPFETKTISNPRGDWHRLPQWCHAVVLESGTTIPKEGGYGEDGSFLAVIYFTNTFKFSGEVTSMITDQMWEEHAINFGW